MATRNENHRNHGRRSNDSSAPQIRVPWARGIALLIGIGCWISAAFMAAARENEYAGTPWTQIWSLVLLGLAFISFALFARWMMTTSWDRKSRDIDSLIRNVVGFGLGFTFGGQNAAHMHQDARSIRQTKAEAQRERQRQAARKAPQPQARPAARPRPAQIPAPAPQPLVDPRRIKLAAAAQVIAMVHTRAMELSQRGTEYRLVAASIDGLMSDLGRMVPPDQFRFEIGGIPVNGGTCPNLIRAGRRAARLALLEVAGTAGALYTAQNYPAIQRAWRDRVEVLVD